MAQLFDRFGNRMEFLDIVGGDTITDSRPSSINIGVINGEALFDCSNVGSAAIDVRGTFTATLVAEASVDGVNYFSVPMFVPTTEIWQTTITAVGTYILNLSAATRRLRIRASAFTSGPAIVSMRGSQCENIQYAKPIPTTLSSTTLSVANTGITLTIPAAATGLFHYITALRIRRINNSAAAVVGTAQLAYTTTNLAGSLAFTSSNAIGAGAQVDDEALDFTANPLKSSVAATNTTIVAPAAGLGVVVRLTAYYYNCA